MHRFPWSLSRVCHHLLNDNQLIEILGSVERFRLHDSHDRVNDLIFCGNPALAVFLRSSIHQPSQGLTLFMIVLFIAVACSDKTTASKRKASD